MWGSMLYCGSMRGLWFRVQGLGSMRPMPNPDGFWGVKG